MYPDSRNGGWDEADGATKQQGGREAAGCLDDDEQAAFIEGKFLAGFIDDGGVNADNAAALRVLGLSACALGHPQNVERVLEHVFKRGPIAREVRQACSRVQ